MSRPEYSEEALCDMETQVRWGEGIMPKERGVYGRREDRKAEGR